MNSLDLAIEIVAESLQLEHEHCSFQRNTPIMGAFPEFNSITIVSMIASIEDNLGCVVGDDELTADIFETIGSLADFIDSKK